MDKAEREQRGSSFGSVAQAYAQLRPDYPRAAALWALAPAAAARGRADGDVAGLRVLDLGAGTGKLTAVLAGLGAQVTAVEPDPAMLAELRRLLPGVPAAEGSAEAIPAPSQSVDAVLAGQALHWFDMERAIPEIARVLRPGGSLAALWNADDDRVEWVSQLHELYREAGAPSLKRRREEAAHFPADQFGATSFELAQRAEFPHRQRLTAQSLLDLLRTHSRVIVMAAGQRAEVLDGVRDFLARCPQTASGEFDLPIVTLGLRAVRR